MSARLDLENRPNRFSSAITPSTVSSPASLHFQKEVEHLSPILTMPSNVPLEMSQTALEVNQYVSSTLHIVSFLQATSSLLQSGSPNNPFFSSPRAGKLLELYDNEFRSRFIGAVTPTLFSQAFSDFFKRYIALNRRPDLHPPSARVQISEKTPTAGKRKFREVDNFSSTTTPSKPLVKQRDSLGSCQNAIVLRVKQPDSLGPCQNAIVLKEEDLTNLEQQYPGLFALILSARGWKKTLCFRLIQTHVKDSSDVEYKISLFLFLLTKIQPVIGKLLRQVLAKEGMDRTFLIKEEINKLRTFEHNRNKLLELIKDEGYFHIQYGKKTASRHMQADFEKIDEYTRLFEKVEKFLEIS